MTIFRKLTALLLVLLLLPIGLNAQAAQESTDDLVRQLINYFHHYQEDARLDCELILEQIDAQDPELAATWVNILDFWSRVNGDMEFHSGVLPDGLPEDDNHSDIRLGHIWRDTYALNIALGHAFKPYRLPYSADRCVPHSASVFLLLSVGEQRGEVVLYL